jgi:hypothetical protein
MNERKLLELYKNHRRTASLSPEAQERVRVSVLAAIHGEANTTAPEGKQGWHFTFVRFASAALVALLCVTGTAFASSGALPGSVLYPVKRAVEQVRMSTTPSPEAKAKLQVSFAAERLKELQAVEPENDIELPEEIVETSTQKDTAATTTISAEPKEDHAHKTTAQISAETEVTKALGELETTKQELHKRGKEKAAEELGRAIVVFKSRHGHKTKARNTPEKQSEHQSQQPANDHNPDQQEVDHTPPATSTEEKSDEGNFEEKHERRGVLHRLLP